MGGLSWWHWLIIGGAFVLLFGAKRLPDAARGVGRSLRILRAEVAAMPEDEDEDEAAGEAGPAPGAAPAAADPAPAASTVAASSSR